MVVKVEFQGDIRRLRFNIDKAAVPLTWVDELQKVVCAQYGLGAESKFDLKYYDAEGDLCTLVEKTLSDAFKVHAGASGVALKVVVVAKV